MQARVSAPTSRRSLEDAGYKHIPGMMAWRVSKLFRSDLWPTPMIVPTNQDHAGSVRPLSVTCRSSGHCVADHALDARIDGAVAEQFWQLAPPPPGWERMRDAVDYLLRSSSKV